MKILIIILLSTILISCQRVKIIQESERSSVIQNTYRVSTQVWTYDKLGVPLTLELWIQVDGVELKDVDSVKKTTMNAAIPVYNKAKTAIDNQ